MTKTKKAWMFKHEIAKTGRVFGRSQEATVVFEGDQAGTDGKVIYLPEMSNTADLTIEQMMIMRGFIDHEAGHLRHSDMPLIMDKYPRWIKNKKEGLKTLHNSIEDIWMEPLVQKDYIGSTKNIAAVASKVNEREAEAVTGYDMKVVNASTVGMGIRVAGRRKYADNEHARKMWDLLSKEVQDWSEKIVEEANKAESSSDTIRIAKAVWKKLEQDPELKSDPEEFDKEEQESLASQVEDGENKEEPKEEPKESQKSPYKLIEPFFSDLSGSDGRDGNESEVLDMDAVDLGEGPMKDMLKGNIPALTRPTGSLVGGYRIVTTKNDAVVDTKSPSKIKAMFFEFNGKKNSYYNNGSYEEQKAKISSHTAVIKTKLRRGILAQQKRDWEHGREHGRLDTRKLVAAVCGSTSVYKTRTDREDLDTAVLVLVDQSGSMGGSKIETARQCTIALSEALEGTSVSYSIAGFTCFNANYNSRSAGYNYHRYESNYILMYKKFSQRLNSAKNEISRMVAHANNADYDALVWAISELKDRPESRKILVVLSDGEPACVTDASQNELIRHAKAAVEEGEKMGIEIVGLGINSSAVERIYKDHIVVKSLKDFSEVYLNKFIQLLVKKGRKRK